MIAVCKCCYVLADDISVIMLLSTDDSSVNFVMLLYTDDSSVIMLLCTDDSSIILPPIGESVISLLSSEDSSVIILLSTENSGIGSFCYLLKIAVIILLCYVLMIAGLYM